MKLSKFQLRRILREALINVSGEDLQPRDDPPSIDLETLVDELSAIYGTIEYAINLLERREANLHDTLRAIRSALEDLSEVADSVFKAIPR